MPLHSLKGLGEIRAAVRINEVVATMHGRRNPSGPFGSRNAVGDCQHYGISVRHHGDPHAVFGIMAVGHFLSIRQSRSGQKAANSCYVQNVVPRAQPLAALSCTVQLPLVPLAVMEGNQMEVAAFSGHLMRERD